MTQEGFKRKLTSIFSADAAGYSRLMGDDEAETVRTLTSYRSMISAIVKQYSGTVIDSPGDNLLAEFVSVVEAVQCSVAVQKEIEARNDELPEDRRMTFRIGINLGDVIYEEGRIYGDGVNIAARIESLAEPGGVCISGTAYDHVKNKLPFSYEYLGEQMVKNIKDPVRVYRVAMKHEISRGVATKKKRKFSHWRKAIVASGVIVPLLLGAAGYIWSIYFRLPPVERMPEETKAFNLSDGPSVAVLPFVNMSGDPEQEYFSDGLTENIIAALSGCPKLLVIARNSTFAYKGLPIKIRQIARELNVNYVVEGSVQKTKDRVRITVQLIEAESDRHLWAEKYDRELKDIFELQDEITLRIVSALEVQLTEGEQASLRLKGPVNLNSYLKGLKGLEYIRHHNKEDVEKARKYAEEAIALAPDFAGNYILLALTHLQDIWFGSTSSPVISFAHATKNLNKAFSLEKDNSDAYLVLGALYLLKGQHEKSIAAEERAVSLNPNGADAYCQLAFTLIFSGEYKDAIGYVKKGIRLNPNPPAYYFMLLGHAYYGAEHYEGAIRVYKKAINQESTMLFAHLGLVSAYIKAGMEKEALEEAGEVYRLDPKFLLNNYPIPHKNPEAVKDWHDTLRKAGLQ